jgi:peptidyl-prolyl cis-trans isomerase D
MLRSFRSKLSSWLMLGFLVLAVGAIVITGFGTGGMGGLPSAGQQTGAAVVDVGGQEVTAEELERMIHNRLRAAQQQEPELDLGRFLAAGAFDGLLNQLVVGRALWVFGTEQGLIVSDRMIDRVIANIPEFRNFAGQFDDATYRQALQAQGMTEAQLRREIANFLMQRQLQLPIALGARVPESVAVQYASLMLERRRGSVGVVPTDAMAQGIAPSDQEVAAFYARNRVRYTVPERRVLRYALISREQVAANARATDQEIEANYRQNAARYAGSETRNLQQVVLQDENAARAFVARVRGGTSFAAAAQQAQFSAGDIALGQKTREQFTSLANADIATAVFAAEQGAVVGPLRSPLGWHVVRIEGITRATGRPLEAVRAEIATEIETRKAAEAIEALTGRIEERLADGASFDDVVRAEHLTAVETPPVTGSGQVPGQQYQAPPELAAMLRGAFQADPEDTDPVIETITPNERFALVAVTRAIPAAVPPLAEIRDRVRGDVVRQQASARARQLAERIAARINSGVPAARAFAEAGVRLPAPQPVNARRVDIAQRGRQVPPPLVMLFAIPQGRARTLEAPNGAGWFVVHLEERTAGQAACPRQPPAAGTEPPEGCRLIQAARQEFSGQAGTEYADQFARAIQEGITIRRNEEAIRATRQRLLQGTTAAQ